MILFVDAVGGGEAALAASLARGLGRAATAAATTPLSAAPDAARRVLAEVGVDAWVAPTAFTAAAGADVVFVGADPPPSSLVEAGEVSWIEGGFYRGPDPTAFGRAELEHLACARILRDRVERWLSASSAPAS